MLLGQAGAVGSRTDQLVESQHTARGNVENVLTKLGAYSQLQAVVVAARSGLLPADMRPAQRALADLSDPPRAVSAHSYQPGVAGRKRGTVVLTWKRAGQPNRPGLGAPRRMQKPR